MTDWFILVTITLLSGLAMVQMVLKLTRRFDVLDVPNSRSSHSSPTPRGGGLGIFLAASIGLLLAWWLGLPLPHPLVGPALGCLFICAVSAIDDLRPLRAAVRLGVHVVGVSIAIAVIQPSGWLRFPFVGTVLLGSYVWACWLVIGIGLVNAYNFMDGIDGIAGSQGVVASLGWAAIGYVLGDLGATVVGLTLAAACAAFLKFNWSPAKIFLGDVGSTFLGYCFFVLPLWTTQRDPRALLYGLLFLWPFVCDSSITLALRALRRKNIFEAHREHLYQRLVIRGWSHRRVALCYAAASSIGVLVGVLWSTTA